MLGSCKLTFIMIECVVFLTVAVIVLQQPSACSYSISIVEGNNVTLCASIIYLREDVSPANISILMSTSDGSALSTLTYTAVK